MRFGVVGAACALLVGGLARGADAAPLWTNACGADVFSTCATVQLRTDNSTLTLGIQNLSGVYFLFANVISDSGSSGFLDLFGRGGSMARAQMAAGSGPPPLGLDSKIDGGGTLVGLNSTGDGSVDGGTSPWSDIPAGGSNDLWLTPPATGGGGGDATIESLKDGFVLTAFDPTGLGNQDQDETDTEIEIHPPAGDGGKTLISDQPDGSGHDSAANDLAVVPEPASLTLFGLGLSAVAALRRRRRAS